MEDFTWSHISLTFPEWKNNMPHNTYSNYFPKSPLFLNEKIKLDLNNYGLEITLNQKVPNWIKKDKLVIEKMYRSLSEKAYEEISSELKKSMPLLETWRKSIIKYDGNSWIGNLQDNLDFYQESETINLYDYYKFYQNLDTKMNSPSEVLKKISKLPKDSLNDKWKNYYKLTKLVGEKNNIQGKTLTECIQNANNIYNIAPELKELKF